MTGPSSIDRPVDDSLTDASTDNMPLPSSSTDQTAVEEYLSTMADTHEAVVLKFARNGYSKDATPSTDLDLHNHPQLHHNDDHQQTEPAYWPAYMSDEEIASPVDSDDLCDRSSLDARSFSSLASFPDTVAEKCEKAEVQQFVKAQAIVLKPVGRAKVVAVPKPVDILPVHRGLHSQARTIKQARSIPNLGRSYHDAVPPHLHRSARSSPLPIWEDNGLDDLINEYPPLPQHRPLQRRRSTIRTPSVPLIQAASEALPFTQAAKSARVPTSPKLSEDTFSPNLPRTLRKSKPAPIPTSPTSGITRRMTKIGSTFNRFARARHSADSSSSSNNADYPVDPLSPTFHFEPKPTLRRPTWEPSGFWHVSAHATSYYSTYDASVTSPLSPHRPQQSVPRSMRSPAAPIPEIAGRPPAPRQQPKKMVARGASERAPPLVLPPFPDLEDDIPRKPRQEGNHIEALPSRWPMRKQSTPHLRSVHNVSTVAAMG